MKHKVEVVILPTEEKDPTKCALIQTFYSTGEPYMLGVIKSTTNEDGEVLFYSPHKSGGSLTSPLERNFPTWKGQHLYITVSQDVESIKEGDWVYSVLYGVGRVQPGNHANNRGEYPRLVTFDKVSVPYNNDGSYTMEGQKIYQNDCRKIIATTDLEINKNPRGFSFIEDDGNIYRDYPAEVQQSFLKEFVANPDGEYEIKHEEWVGTDNKYYLDLKLNQDNTINITSVEEKMYSREEVIRLCTLAMSQGVINSMPAQSTMSDHRILKDWIKENL